MPFLRIKMKVFNQWTALLTLWLFLYYDYFKADIEFLHKQQYPCGFSCFFHVLDYAKGL